MMNPKELAEAHWSYVEQVLKAHHETDVLIEKCKFHYISAFEHGYKHGVEDVHSDMRTSDFIRGVSGEYYPRKPDIFAATYEPAE